ncbi:multi-sensor hybrid histidine kinase [Novosphingobium nitrogenifigens DSM 19370]|uniref:histidine kinase n=1 Tax=Novosphingobium nitrogenifigens DSM 19370 TaxID=983920 RepID=F1Z829_9SPHN|nr:ATP-binding protein [Novosphingobium nitrogenifigens]EGD59196.1 multi-sensor hybrid histidine kinase [Novosphingobium nitrogenifigens DSM 19370]
MNALIAESPAPSRSWRDVLIVAAGLTGTAGLLGFVTGDVLPPLAFAGGAMILAGAIRGGLALRPQPESLEFAAPDWSVTYAAIEHPSDAIAITDRAGRLVCANGRFTEWFGTSPPPRLPLAAADPARADEAARIAWRDGSALVEEVTAAAGTFSLSVERAGRGEDHLVWRLVPIVRDDPVAQAISAIGGKIGRALGRESIQAAVVAPDGHVLAANRSFAERAAGVDEAGIVGSDFVSHFEADAQQDIYFVSERGRGLPVRFLHVPISDPDDGEEIDPSICPSVFLIVDTNAGVGDARAGLPQIEALLARLPLGLGMVDRDGRFLFANSAFLRAAGHEGKQPPPYPSDLVIREDKGAFADAVRRHAQGAPTSGDVAVRLRNTPDEPVLISLAAVRGLGEGAVLLSLKDSSEETRLKHEIAQASKMQAVGQLAGGVAHDFNNVLTAIIGYCDLILMRHTPGDSDYDDIQQIKANSNRAASLTRQLLAFSRQQTLRPQVLQLPDVVAEVSTLLKRLLGEKITLEVSHDRGLGAVRADPVQLEQVLLNLAVNGRDAMADNKVPGVLKLMTRRISADQVRAMKVDFLPVGEYTALIVEDNGHGIAPELLDKIFEPFFTTKDRGKGTGLGLATVYGIVKQSGGFIFADSEQGKWTRFSIFLPVHIPDAGELAEAARERQPEVRRQKWTHGGRVLLVEDEDTVRAVAERALVRQGYEVTTASDGEEGFETLVRTYEEGGGFDLVVSDVVMPTMDGPAMAREIRAHRPELPFLFMSGYAEETLRREIDIPNMHFLPKPFSVQQIVSAVEDVLRGTAGA